MKQFFQEIIETGKLSKVSAFEALSFIGKGEANASQIAGFLGMYALKGVSIDEFEGFRDAMLNLAVPIDLSDYQPIDVCGTGGDGKDTFNISTTSAFVIAGTGQKVAKHGNHGVSSAVGSSTVLEYLGVNFTNDANALKEKIETAHICYLHAPLFHPAMRHVGPHRKDLGLKTFFNILGPVLNPAKVTTQMTGTFDLATADLYAQVFERAGAKVAIVHGLDGYDEVSLTSDFQLIKNGVKSIVCPAELGLNVLQASELHGGETTAEAAAILLNVLQNQATYAQKAVVLANSAVALQLVNAENDLAACVQMAEESINSGKAYDCFKKLVS